MTQVLVGLVEAHNELKNVYYDTDSGQVLFYNEQDEVAYELDIPVIDPIPAQAGLANTLANGEFGEAIGVILSKEGFYVIVDGDVAELRRLGDKKGTAIETYKIDLYIEAELNED